MAGFLYFAPNHTSPIPHAGAIPPEWGVWNLPLRAILAGESLTYADMPSGPNGDRGTMFCLGGRGTQLRYSPDQVWRPVKSEGSDQVHYLVGLDPGQRPTAGSLLRKKNLGGTPIEIGEEEWKIPILHVPFDQWSSLSSIPRTMAMAEDGSFELRPVTEYDAVCERVASFYRRSEDPFEMPISECFSFVCDVLGVNYHLGASEVALLKLFSTSGDLFLKIYAEVMGAKEMERVLSRKKEGSDLEGPS